MLALFGELQRTAVDQWQRNLRATQDWQRTATDGLAAALTQQAYLQRQGIEYTRALVHLGAVSTDAAMQDGDAVVQPAQTAVDTQLDVLALLQSSSMATVLTATELTPPAEPIDAVAPPGDGAVDPDAADNDCSGSSSESAADADPAPADPETTADPPADADDGGQPESEAPAGEYAELLEQSVPDVKERVRTEELDIEQLIGAERAGEARVTLLDWLERRLETAGNE